MGATSMPWCIGLGQCWCIGRVIAAGGQHAPIDECLRDLGELSLRLREHIVYVFATPVLLHPSPGDVVLGLLDNCMCSLACLNGDVLDRDVIKESIW